MTFVARLRANHQAVADRIAATDRLCDRPTPPNAVQLAEARWALVRLLMDTVSIEEKAVFGPLEAHPDPRMQARGRDLRASQLAFNDDLIAHAQRWTAEALQKDWLGFRRATGPVHRSILERSRWEERTLFPLETELDGREEAASRHNWARQAWSVRDAMVAGG